MTSTLTERRPPPPTRPPIPPLQARKRPSTSRYWVAAIVAVLGLTAALVWGAVGTSNTLDRINGFDRLAVPGATTVSVTDPGTMVVYHESAAEVARYAEPTANARSTTRWDPGTRTIVTVPSAGDAPTWQQLGLSVTGPAARPCRSPPTGPAPATTSSRASRPGGGDVPGHDRRAVPGVGGQGHRGWGHAGRG